MLSIPHMIVLFIVVLVIFGPQKLPELARGLGKLMAEFRKASTDFRGAFEEEMREMERQALQAERKKAAEAVAASTVTEASQPAMLVAPAGTETPSNEAPPETGATEAPVIAPVAEAIPRSTEESFESKPEEATAATGVQESLHDTEHPA
jgi:TatA/E family protein of Tat protein translocase